MLPIANRPILEHIIVAMKVAGIREFLIIVGYLKDKIIEHFGDGSGFGVKIEYIEQETQKGTADAIRVAGNSVSERFLVTNGDVLAGIEDIKKIIDT